MARSCPRCRFELYIHTLPEGVEVDHCHHCGGSYLDAGEESELFGPLLASENWKDSDLCKDKGLSKLLSPASNQPMRAFRVFFAQPVEIDRCEQTGGLWFDSGEADRLREIIEKASQADKTPLEENRPKKGIGTYIFQFASGFPIEMWNPRKLFPWATVSIIVACVVVFGLELMAGLDEDNVVVAQFALHPDLYSGKNVWSSVTYMFLHGGFLHIIGNLYLLYILGDNIEDKLGPRFYLLLYGLSGLVGGLVEIAISNAGVPVVGASGAVAGVMAAYWVLFPKVRLRILIVGIPVYFSVAVYFGFWIGMNLLMGVLGAQGVAWFCHIGGFAVGLLMAWPYRPRSFSETMQERIRNLPGYGRRRSR